MTSARRLSEPTGLPRAVLDSDVIYSRVLHDLFGRLGTDPRLITLIWSDELLAEARAALMRGKPISEEAADRWVSYLSNSFPNERIDLHGHESLPSLPETTTDPGDRHVSALAIHGRADLLITNDRGYLHDALKLHGITVIRPDDILTRTLEDHPQAIIDVLSAQAAAWAGGKTVEDLIDATERAGAMTFAARARTLVAE